MLDRIEASLERERVFVADASHELRTPLAILRTELELAEARALARGAARAVASAGEEVDRLSRLAEDLLVIARSDQGRLPIKREPVGWRAARAGRRPLRARAAETGRSIAVEAPPGAEASLDPLRMEQALGNLVDNALRHGAGRSACGAARNGDGAELSVADEGAGFRGVRRPRLRALHPRRRGAHRRRLGPRPRDRPGGRAGARRRGAIGRRSTVDDSRRRRPGDLKATLISANRGLIAFSKLRA